MVWRFPRALIQLRRVEFGRVDSAGIFDSHFLPLEIFLPLVLFVIINVLFVLARLTFIVVLGLLRPVLHQIHLLVHLEPILFLLLSFLRQCALPFVC